MTNSRRCLALLFACALAAGPLAGCMLPTGPYGGDGGYGAGDRFGGYGMLPAFGWGGGWGGVEGWHGSEDD